MAHHLQERLAGWTRICSCRPITAWIHAPATHRSCTTLGKAGELFRRGWSRYRLRLAYCRFMAQIVLPPQSRAGPVPAVPWTHPARRRRGALEPRARKGAGPGSGRSCSPTRRWAPDASRTRAALAPRDTLNPRRRGGGGARTLEFKALSEAAVVAQPRRGGRAG